MEVLGIDIGGSGIKGAPVNIETGQLLAERFRIPTPEPANPENVTQTVAEIVNQFSWEGPIGCGFPSPLKDDRVLTAANISDLWIGKNVAEYILQATGCPTHAINDVDAAGLAEMEFGAGRGINGTIIMVALGTGIGTAMFTDGILFPNTELGHIILKNGKEAEKYASNAVRKSKQLTWEEWTRRLNPFFSYVDELLRPDMYILGGGVSKYHEEFLPLLRASAPIIPADMRNKAGIIGAAMSFRYAEDHLKLMAGDRKGR